MYTNSSSQSLKIRLAVGFIVVTGLLAVIIISLATHTGQALANSTDLANAESANPGMVGSRIDTCILCHTSVSAIPVLNPFGTAYLNAGRNTAAFAAIANLDSDGDGYTNAQEIAAFTFPGDPNDHPAAVATSTVPAPTSTQAAPTNTLPAGPTATQPAGPTATKTKIPIMTLTPGPSQTPGSGKPTKTKRATEVDPTENSGYPAPTEHEGEGKGSQTKTPNPDPQPTRTKEFHATRTPDPTQVCNTPGAGGDKKGDGHNPCGGDHQNDGAHQNDGGQKGNTGNQDGNFFLSAWNNLTNYLFKHNKH